MDCFNKNDLQETPASNHYGRANWGSKNASASKRLEFYFPPFDEVSWETVVEQRRNHDADAVLHENLLPRLSKPEQIVDESSLTDGETDTPEESEESVTSDELFEPANLVPLGLPMYVPLVSSSTNAPRPPNCFSMPSWNKESPFDTGGDNHEASDDLDITSQEEKQHDAEKNGDVGILPIGFSKKMTFAEPANKITTFMISQIPLSCSAKQFRNIVLQGFKDAIDYLYTPCDLKTGVHVGIAVINLVDASSAEALQWALACSFPECKMVPADVQGRKACTTCWGPVGELPSPNMRKRITPSAVDSPQIKQQLHKTKLCTFFIKSQCAFGADCAYAHSPSEMQRNPDLTKTRLCYDFFRQKCFRQNCTFAHGYDELRSTEGVYKTVLCRWSTTGSCKIGAACRYAHTLEELRPPAAGMAPTIKL